MTARQILKEGFVAKDHLAILVVCLMTLLAPFFLEVDDGSRVHLPLLQGAVWPGGCPFQELTQAPCPTCGLTRSFIAASRLRLGEALGHHRLGLLAYVLVLSQIPYRLWSLVRERGSRRPGRPGGQKLLALIVFLFLINWAITLALG